MSPVCRAEGLAVGPRTGHDGDMADPKQILTPEQIADAGLTGWHQEGEALIARFDTGDFGQAWGGIASVQLGLPIMWSEARRRGMGLADVVRWMASAPAAFAGLSDRGAIRPGARADLVVLSPDDAFVVLSSGEADSLTVERDVTVWFTRA